MKTYSIIKRIFGKELKQVNVKIYATKEAATNAGNYWGNDCTIHSRIRSLRNFEVIENK
jgi:hypothetical protein